MPDAIWIDRESDLADLAGELGGHDAIRVDTEFLRESTFFPQLCVVQLGAGEHIWCIDALACRNLAPLLPALTSALQPKIIHAARQDLEAIHLHSGAIVGPVFDTQIAAGCVGMKPQIGYAELAQVLLGVTVPKGQTRTDWSRRPLSAAQLTYAAEDVLYLGTIAARLGARLAELGRTAWALEDCAALSDPTAFTADPARAWERLRGLAQLDPVPRQRARELCLWREREARSRDLPRSWIMTDAALLEAAQANPATATALRRLLALPEDFPAALADGAIAALQDGSRQAPQDQEPARDARLTPEQKSLVEKLARIVDARAAALAFNAEILAPRGELKALATGSRATPCLEGWRRDVIGTELLAAL
jgi:ribonuclease D